MTRDPSGFPPIAELSSLNVSRNPNQTAFAEAGGESVTWEGFDRRTRVAAAALSEHVCQGDRVAFHCESSLEHVILWIATLRLGAIGSNVHTRASTRTVSYSIDSLQPEVLVIDEHSSKSLTEEVLAGLGDVLVLSIGDPDLPADVSLDTFLADGPDDPPNVTTRGDDVAAVMWTSGTTGRPKGWCQTHRSLALKGFGRDKVRTSIELMTASPSFAPWYANVVATVVNGSTLVFQPEWDPERWAELVDTHGVTTAAMVPTMWRQVLNLDSSAYDLSSLRSIMFTGEKIDASTLERLREEVCPDVRNVYGSTEMRVARNFNEELVGDRIESVGKPVVGTDVRIIEPDGEPDDTLGPDEVGEIIVRALDRPAWGWANTADVADHFTDGWWYSGDLGYRDADGYLFLEGRKDSMIKSKGVKVFPTPIEARLNDHPAVAQAAVVGVPDDEYGQKVTAVVTPAENDISADTLDEWCRESESVADFERPREYHFVERDLPRTPTQKLDRNRVKELIDR